MSGPALRLPRGVLEQVQAHARAQAPREACGVLGGRDGPTREVAVALPCRNVAARPALEYVAHPRDQLDAFLRIEDELGFDVVGVYHSHPGGPPGPSSVDAARATYPGLTHLIVWLAPREGWGAWRWSPMDGFKAEGLGSSP